MSPRSKKNPPRKPAMRPSAGKEMQTFRNLYVSLPSDIIPAEMLDGPLTIDDLRMSLDLGARGLQVVHITCQDPKVHLYSLDKSLEEIQAEHVSQQNEILVLRNRLMLMAVNLGLGDEVPSVKNHATWPLLASKILRAIGLAGQGERRKDQDDFPSGIVFKNFCQVARRRRSS